MIIYLIRNRINGKGYIGQTILDFDTRWSGHLYGKQAIDHAIRKYGADSFEHCILAMAETLDQLNTLEEYYIKEQNTLAPNGYNLLPGGRNHQHSPETIAKISASKKGKSQPKDRKRISQEDRRKLSEAHKGQVPWNKGRKTPPEVVDKLRTSHLGNKPSKETRVKMSEAQKRRWERDGHISKRNNKG